ncbi:rho GTPase-activating protein 32 isoform X2 [Cimex lectularius]|uniref:GTPase-activating protein CdGAPr n=1 Tax=Cimex lectularius TaxID=79782 RepID=A0A8I6TEP3_CIMLE|nr:rho GTPase-activating protein 32 isoform X2 [Cimex lectularius]
MASVSGAQTSRALHDIIPQYPKSKIAVVGSVRLKSLVSVGNPQSTTSRFPKLEECAHFHYDHVDLQPIQLNICEEDANRGEFEGITLCVRSGQDSWKIHRTYSHFCKLDQQLHQCVFDRKFSNLPILSEQSPKSVNDRNVLLNNYVRRLSDIGSGCAISCGPVLSWFELDNRGRRIVASGHGINTPAVAAAFATTPYTAHATDELSFQIGDMISVIDMPPAEESSWWRGKRGFVVGFFPSNCVAVITDKIPNEITLAEPSKPVLRKHGKLIAFFRAFILSRPSRRRLKQSGILKERVFGCDLSEHLLNSGHEIPLVLKCCSEFIENHGIVDGIYRLSGVTSNIQRLRSIFDEDRVPVLTEDSGIKQDIHGVASLLKMYFRELPNPLCTYQLYDEFVAAVQSPSEKRLENMKKVVQKLPPPHYRTLEYLMGHLGRVCNHSTGTGMTARNVAIVWAPNLLRCRSLDQGVAALQGVGVQAVVTEYLILYSPLIFNNQPGDLSLPRPKSLAVCSPTKLLTLQEAQARGQHSPTQGVADMEITGEKLNETSYHTIIELPRKRQPLNWRTIFTPRRNHQTKSPRRFKRKTVMKSAEFLSGGATTSSSTQQVSCPPTSTHSRSVSHDSYFDTMDHPSTSSLIETQHEGLSLSLDLSELQMNFDIEESEMRIFSEDETNQLFSSGASIVFGTLETESNLEQRFSNQELRYIDSYSPDPMEGESPSEDILTPGYQPLLTPNSYDNLRVNNACDCSMTSSKKSDISPYSYEKLSESPNVVPDVLLQKKENDLYESCSDNPHVSVNVYESMELEQEPYEPVTMSVDIHKENAYENDSVKNDRDIEVDNNIYEDVQYTPSEIYEQVSNFRNSVNEVNKLVKDTSPLKEDIPPISKDTQLSNCQDLMLSDELYENTKAACKTPVVAVSSTEEIQALDSWSRDQISTQLEKNISSKMECDDKITQTILTKDFEEDGVKRYENDKPLVSETTNYIQSSKVQTSKCLVEVPERGDKETVFDSYKESKYENVSFTLNRSKDDFVENLININEKVKEINEEPNLNDNFICDTNLSDFRSIESDENVEKPSPKKVNDLKRQSVDLNLEIEPIMEKVNCSVVSEVLKRDCVEKSKDSLQTSVPLESNLSGKDCDFGKTENIRMMFEGKVPFVSSPPSVKDNIAKLSPLPLQTTVIREEFKVKQTFNDPVAEKHSPVHSVKEEIKSKLTTEESDVERRERIERYKEERRNFFRNKYKTDSINNNDERDDELIRRIKQKTKLKEMRDLETGIVERLPLSRKTDNFNESKKSPTKTTVSISYSPTKAKAPLSLSGSLHEQEEDRERVKRKNDKSE